MLLSAYPLIQHLRENLMPQANQAAEKINRPGMKWYILSVMEFVRLVGIAGFLVGRWDRIRDKKYIESQKAWMGVGSLDELQI